MTDAQLRIERSARKGGIELGFPRTDARTPIALISAGGAVTAKPKVLASPSGHIEALNTVGTTGRASVKSS